MIDPKVEHINISKNYVVFEGGCMAPIDLYLDIDDCVTEDAELACVCWVNHPDLGPLEVVIHHDDPPTLQ